MKKIIIGKGNLEHFEKVYNNVTQINQGQMWSSLYPVNTDLNNRLEVFKQTYEFVIGYEVFNNEAKK